MLDLPPRRRLIARYLNLAFQDPMFSQFGETSAILREILMGRQIKARNWWVLDKNHVFNGTHLSTSDRVSKVKPRIFSGLSFSIWFAVFLRCFGEHSKEDGRTDRRFIRPDGSVSLVSATKAPGVEDFCFFPELPRISIAKKIKKTTNKNSMTIGKLQGKEWEISNTVAAFRTKTLRKHAATKQNESKYRFPIFFF